jgi:hypothetical protein
MAQNPGFDLGDWSSSPHPKWLLFAIGLVGSTFALIALQFLIGCPCRYDNPKSADIYLGILWFSVIAFTIVSQVSTLPLTLWMIRRRREKRQAKNGIK